MGSSSLDNKSEKHAPKWMWCVCLLNSRNVRFGELLTTNQPKPTGNQSMSRYRYIYILYLPMYGLKEIFEEPSSICQTFWWYARDSIHPRKTDQLSDDFTRTWWNMFSAWSNFGWSLNGKEPSRWAVPSGSRSRAHRSAKTASAPEVTGNSL